MPETPASRLPPPASPANSIEDNLLALALRHSQVVPAAVEALLEQGLEHHPALRELLGGGLEDLLEDPASQQIWAAFSALPIESRPPDEAGLEAWANWLEEPLRERFLAVLAVAQRNPQDFRHRREAEDCARSIRLEQAMRLVHRLNEQVDLAEGMDEQLRISKLRDNVIAYWNALKYPRRSSTFPDIRDTLGKT